MYQGIYLITVSRGERPSYYYVGQTNSFESRQQDHISALRRGKHHNRLIQRCWNKYGETAFVWSVLEIVESTDQLTSRELFWFQLYVDRHGRRGILNLCPPSDNPLREPEVRALYLEGIRRRASNETWRRNSIAAIKARNNDPDRLRKLSVSTAKWHRDNPDKAAARYVKRSQNAEWQLNCAEGNRARANDPEWRVALQEGIERTRSKHYTVIDPNGIPVKFFNLHKFCREKSLSPGNLLNVINGKRKHHKGWTRSDE